jgi:hypothetical protein
LDVAAGAVVDATSTTWPALTFFLPERGEAPKAVATSPRLTERCGCV